MCISGAIIHIIPKFVHHFPAIGLLPADAFLLDDWRVVSVEYFALSPKIELVVLDNHVQYISGETRTSRRCNQGEFTRKKRIFLVFYCFRRPCFSKKFNSQKFLFLFH